MADVSADLKNWSNTAASNMPSGSTTVGTGMDDNLRQIQATVKQDLAHVGANIASASTTDLGAVAGLFHTITGTTTITSFGTVSAGIWKILTFSGALTITHNATSLICPGGANISITAGDGLLCESLGSGNWKVYPLYIASGLYAAKGANSDITSMTGLGLPTVLANPIRVTDLQANTFGAYTTGGTSTAYTLTTLATGMALTINERWTVKFNATAGVAPTLNRDGKGAVSIKVYNASGSKVAASSSTIIANMISDVIYDGTDYVVLDTIPVNTVLTNSLGADVNLTNTSTYFDGPSVAQGTAGIWFVSGTVTMKDTGAGTTYHVILWDGVTTPVIASAIAWTSAASAPISVSVSGYIINPAGNLRISVKDIAHTTNTAIRYNETAAGKDSTITAIRIG